MVKECSPKCMPLDYLEEEREIARHVTMKIIHWYCDSFSVLDIKKRKGRGLVLKMFFSRCKYENISATWLELRICVKLGQSIHYKLCWEKIASQQHTMMNMKENSKENTK